MSCDHQGWLIDRQSRRVGFKHVEWRRTKGAAHSADPYLCVVNGKETLLFGVDWTPIRPNFADLRDEDYRLRLSIYRDCGMTILRVWGGGFLEKDCFYDYCDEMGLLLWQEFPLSSSGMDNYPPDDPASVEALARIAETYIDRRQHHVSILLWCGGNELMDDKNGVKSSQPTLTIKTPSGDCQVCRNRSQEGSGPSFSAHQPLRSGGQFNLQDCGKGVFWDVHGPWNLDGPVDGAWKELWDQGRCHVPFGNGRALREPRVHHPKYEGNLKDTPGTHQNPLWNRQPWWIDWPKFVEEKGREPRDLEEYVTWSQARQSAALTLAARVLKSRFPACGGMIIWMGHEPSLARPIRPLSILREIPSPPRLNWPRSSRRGNVGSRPRHTWDTLIDRGLYPNAGSDRVGQCSPESGALGVLARHGKNCVVGVEAVHILRIINWWVVNVAGFRFFRTGHLWQCGRWRLHTFLENSPPSQSTGIPFFARSAGQAASFRVCT